MALEGVIKGLVCIEKRYQSKFTEIETDNNYVHFLIQPVPTYSVTLIVTMLKSQSASYARGFGKSMMRERKLKTGRARELRCETLNETRLRLRSGGVGKELHLSRIILLSKRICQ